MTEAQTAKFCGSGNNLTTKCKMINIFVACTGAFEKLVCIKERNDMRVRETKLNIFMLGRLSTE